MRLISYSRVSTEDQQTAGAQLDLHRQYARLYGHEIVASHIETASARSLRRPALQKALEQVSAGEADGLIISKLDRLTRRVIDWGHLVDTYFSEKSQMHLISVMDQVDTTTASGRLVANVLASVAQGEREIIAERTKSSMSYLKKQGRCLTSRPPYGWKRSESNRKKLIRDQHEQEIRELILKKYQETGSAGEVARILNHRKIKPRIADKWTRQVVTGILNRDRQMKELEAQ